MAQQLLDLGTVQNDKTGTKGRAGGDIINDNFTELYNILDDGNSPTFTGLTLSGLTAGSIPFAGTGGLISEDNANLFWDDTSNFLGLGTNTPTARFEIEQTGSTQTDGIQLNSVDAGNRIGQIYMDAFGQMIFRNTGGGNDNITFIGAEIQIASGTLLNLNTSAGLRLNDNNPSRYGSDSDYSIRYNSTSDDLEFCDGNVTGSNIRLSINSVGNISCDSTIGSLIVNRMTTTQMNALTAINGMIIYNLTTTAFNFRENGAWVSGSGLT
jgi:hypothetical protein